MTNLILILSGLTIVAVWLDGVRSAVNSLSGGFVRSLDDEAKNAKAAQWLELKKELGFTLRSLSFITTAAFTSFCYLHIVNDPVIEFKVDSWYGLKKGAAFALFMLLFLLLKETIGTIWLSYYRFSLLRFSLPIINILRIPLKPYEMILMNSYNKSKSREEEASEEKEVSAEDEILSLVETDKEGNLEEDERRMIQGVFDLNDTIVREAMTPRVNVDAINIDCSITEAKDKFVESNFSRLPVYRESIDHIEGILYAKDFLNEKKLNAESLSEIIHKANFIPETKPLDEVLEDFKESQCHFAVVNDQYGGTAGIITIEDVLEEIVGDIRDEFDANEEEVFLHQEDDGSLVVDAKASLVDINRVKPDHLIPEHEDYETIGGCIYSEISRIPVVGEIIELRKYTAKILDADERSIKRLQLFPKNKEEFEETKS